MLQNIIQTQNISLDQRLQRSAI